MTNRRVKSDKIICIEIGSFEQADNALQKLGELQLAINQAEHTAADKINEAKLELAEATKPLQEEIKGIVYSLELFANARKSDFGKDRSRKLGFGKIGWRKSSFITLKKDTLELIKKLFSKQKAQSCIITKEAVSKDALAKLTDEDLKSVNARRKETDAFFAEPDLPEAVDYQ
ncbi:MAG: host-nuclease inhibitor Gam family protein [Dehalococcoidales bacterium]|nr:host-nuclease inhibitor Gam family protein [Candidatus Neomarinimicrobiota bacterium]MDD5220465.1 host-nuclease inhibitor Gam family protein [Candidatus Bipolaricaulis sp.]